MLNTKTCLQQSELYPSQVLHQQFVDLYIEENDYLSGNFFLLQYISHSLRNCTLTLITLWANLDDKSVIFIFIFFFQKVGFDISCRLSPKETIFDDHN